MQTPISTEKQSDLLSDLINRSYDFSTSPFSSQSHSTPSNCNPQSSSLRKLSAQLANLQTEHNELLIRYDQHVNESQNTIKTLEDRCSALEKDRQFLLLQEEIVESRAAVSIETMRDSVKAMESDRDSLRRQIDRQANEWAAREASLTATIKSLRQQHNSSLSSADSSLQIKELQSKITILNNQVSHLKEERDTLYNESISLSASLSTYSLSSLVPVNSKEPSELETSLSKLKQELYNSESEVKRLRTENALLQEQIRSLEHSKTCWQETLLENNQLKHQNALLASSSANTNASTASIQHERGSIADLKELRRLQEAVSSLQQQISANENDVGERVFVLRLHPVPHQTAIPIEQTENRCNCVEAASALREQLSCLERKLERFREVFKAKIKEFREIVFTLLGYQIDLQSDGSIRMLSLYAFHESDFIYFKRDSNNSLALVESDFLGGFQRELELYVKVGNSFPAFLSHITSALWERSTVPIGMVKSSSA